MQVLSLLTLCLNLFQRFQILSQGQESFAKLPRQKIDTRYGAFRVLERQKTIIAGELPEFVSFGILENIVSCLFTYVDHMRCSVSSRKGNHQADISCLRKFCTHEFVAYKARLFSMFTPVCGPTTNKKSLLETPFFPFGIGPPSVAVPKLSNFIVRVICLLKSIKKMYFLERPERCVVSSATNKKDHFSPQFYAP